MKRPKVFITRVIPEKGLEMIQAYCETDVWQGELPPSRETLIEHIRGREGLLSLLTDQIDGEVMDLAGSGLKVISNHAVGWIISTWLLQLDGKFRWAIPREY